MVWKEPNRRRYENLKIETIQKRGGRRQMHYQQRTIISFQPERKFRPITKIFRARWKHDCTGRPSSTDQMPPSELLIMLQKLTKT